MKPVAAKIFEGGNSLVFSVRNIELPFFAPEFHFHRECQLVYVLQGDGKRIIGDSISSFGPDELVLLGSDIPHVWRCDKGAAPVTKDRINARSIALFFDPERLVETAAHFIPVQKLQAFLLLSKRGMTFHGSAKTDLKQLLFDMQTQKGISQTVSFFRMLDIFTRTRQYDLLASEGYINDYNPTDNDRVNAVFAYVMEHFTREIDLDHAAAVACMNKQAFCRYFKSRTQKTFVEFVNQVRIGHACKLIAGGEDKIGTLAYECGFNSISNFNTFFKAIMKMTPSAYKKMLSEL